jgi:hypothetical protein
MRGVASRRGVYQQALSPRAGKRPLSRYAYRSLRVTKTSYKATLSFDILAPPSP